MSTLQQILKEGTLLEKKALFNFKIEDGADKIILKFNLWSRYFFPTYFSSPDAPFHKEIDSYNIKAYKGDIDSFTDIAFRGGAKTARTKLFCAFAIANDTSHYRRYFRVLSEDLTNSKQIVTDIYNMFVSPRVKEMYPEIFEKTTAKREETMGAFTTSTGIKIYSDTVGAGQRGALQEDSRPDFDWYEDFENRKTLRSAVTTKAIWDNMEEARTGQAKGGASIYTCNYISEAGNVHKLVQRESERNIVMIVPIIKDGIIAWDRYTQEEVDQMAMTDDDFEGERLCQPSASKDIYFDRESLEKMTPRQPVRTSADFKIFYNYDPSHRYGSGHDTSKGVGLDSSTSVFLDFDTVPARVTGTFKNNLIKPEVFGDEIYRQQELFPGSIAGIENNYGAEAILRMKQLGGRMYARQVNEKKIDHQEAKEYGWNTNKLTKPKMMAALFKAIEDGLIDLSDKDLIQEAKSYTRNDLLEYVNDPRLTTRHFDLLIACAIAWQMKDYATYPLTDFIKQMEHNESGYNENEYD